MHGSIESEPILDLDVGVYFVWPNRRYLFVLPHNPMGHNEDIVSAWGCLWHPTLDKGETSGTIYVWTPLNLEDAF